MAFLLPNSRPIALKLAQGRLLCRQCLRQQYKPIRLLLPIRRIQVRSGPGPVPVQSHPSASASPATTKPPTAQATVSSTSISKPSTQAFPDVTTSRAVAYWLLGSAASVFGIVVFGGLTRLTESGLSITEWRPVTGSLPPLSVEAWTAEFDKYRASPEFALLNPHMTADEFKKIYYMEWTHRLWGRIVGLSFLLPTIYFVARRRVSARMALNLVGISGLIGFQGFIGWWMVQSGLKDDLFASGSHPRVSQYRLTAHLATAFLCYSWMLLSGLAVLRTRRMLFDPTAAVALASSLRNPTLSRFRTLVTGLTALVFTTIMSGALVAGLDAGLIYNEFPYMGVGLAPPSSELWDKFYSRREDGADLWWRNMLENPSTVQLDHRILATTTFCAILALFAYSRRASVAAVLPRAAKSGVTGVVHLALLQVSLGISTLIYMVPIPLAAAHQAGSLALLSGVLVLGHRLRVPKGTLAAVQRHLVARKPTHLSK